MLAALINLYLWLALFAGRSARVEAHKSDAQEPLTRAEWKSVGALILLVIPVTLVVGLL